MFRCSRILQAGRRGTCRSTSCSLVLQSYDRRGRPKKSIHSVDAETDSPIMSSIGTNLLIEFFLAAMPAWAVHALRSFVDLCLVADFLPRSASSAAVHRSPFSFSRSSPASFNMLAQPMASSKMFPYVPKNQLKRTNRWPRVSRRGLAVWFDTTKSLFVLAGGASWFKVVNLWRDWLASRSFSTSNRGRLSHASSLDQSRSGLSCACLPAAACVRKLFQGSTPDEEGLFKVIFDFSAPPFRSQVIYAVQEKNTRRPRGRYESPHAWISNLTKDVCVLGARF